MTTTAHTLLIATDAHMLVANADCDPTRPHAMRRDGYTITARFNAADVLELAIIAADGRIVRDHNVQCDMFTFTEDGLTQLAADVDMIVNGFIRADRAATEPVHGTTIVAGRLVVGEHVTMTSTGPWYTATESGTFDGICSLDGDDQLVAVFVNGEINGTPQTVFGFPVANLNVATNHAR